MKKIYASLLSVVSFVSINAQLTQTNHAPAAGDTYQVYHCDSVSTSPGAGAAGTLWDFSAVTTYSNLVTTYSAAAVTNPAYPSANVGVASSVSNTAYMNSSAGSLLYYGGNISIGSIVATLNYSAPAVYASYPMSISTTSSSVTGGTINVTSPIGANGTFTGNSTVVADGTGTLIAGGITFTNVMRVVTTQTVNFTTNFAPGTVIQKDYNYYSAGIKAPVFSISTASATVLNSTSSQTMVTRLKGVTTSTNSTVGIIENQVAESQVKLYPNPANSEVSFMNLDASAIQISIYDMTGKLIDAKNVSDAKVRFDVSSYNKGIYFYQVNGENNNRIATGKLTIVH